MGRDFDPKQIFVTEEAARADVTGEIVEQYPQVKVTQVKDIRDVPFSKRSLKQRIERGKHTLMISLSRKFVEHSSNDEYDMICPTFHKLTPATHCPFDCQFCFLQSRHQTVGPWVCVYTNLAKMYRAIALGAIYSYFQGKQPADINLVFNAGEMCDSLATLGIVPGLLSKLGEFFADVGNDKLLLVTRSAKVDELLGPAHNGHTIVTWSLNRARLTVQTAKGGMYNECSTYVRKGKSVCNANRVPQHELEQQILQHLAQKLFTVERISQIVRQLAKELAKFRRKNRHKVEPLRRELESVRLKMRRHYDAIEGGAVDLTLVGERLRELKSAEAELLRRIEQIQGPKPIPPYLFKTDRLCAIQQTLGDIFLSNEHGLAKRYLNLLLEKTEINGNEVALVGDAAALCSPGLSVNKSEVVKQT